LDVHPIVDDAEKAGKAGASSVMMVRTTEFLSDGATPMLRSAAAVVAGYLLFAFPAEAWFRLSGHDPHAPAGAGFMAATIVYGILFAILGGYVAALLAARFEIEHAFAVATLIAAIGAASFVVESPGESKWTQLSAILIIAPAAILGGYLRRRQLRAKLMDLRRSRHQ
jgi:hypothetical protein